MSLETWLIYVVTTCIASMTPGPNMLLSMTIGMTRGKRAAFASSLGGVSAMLIMLFASAAGLSAILSTSAEAFTVVKWGGVIYLLYLGIKAWRSPAMALDNTASGSTSTTSRKKDFFSLYRQAFLVGASNPKAMIFFAAFLPQFINLDLPQGPQLAILAGSFVVIEFFWLMSYALGGSQLVPLLKRSGKVQMVNRISGGALIGASALLASR
ncbi:LysE family translocator [Kiloniella laminariae]|uniref:LysE family translocator n=1 Tax=Kiloniella laminariae TaxID=454162 RepID=UPI000365B429|nr:LysE family translocator [Kiloniella laminariae]